MKTFVRVLSLMLACLFCVTLIVACNDTSSNGDDDGDNGLIDSRFDVNGRLNDNLPADLNFGGEEVTVLYWNDVERPEFEQESITGDNVRDAIYDRNNQIEDRLNIIKINIGNVYAMQNRLCLRKRHCSVFHSHTAIDNIVKFLFCKKCAFGGG